MLTGPQNSPTETPAARNDGSVAACLAVIQSRIVSAALRFGRDANHITLLAVSKQQPAERVRELAALGHLHFGENYLQEALAKIEALSDLGICWHYIGQIQSNKTRPIAESFDWVHTVDRLKIAQRLSEQRPMSASPLHVCIQVKLAEEPGKGGVIPSETLELARAIAALPRLKLRGLMCIPPPAESFDEQLRYFNMCADVLGNLNRAGFELDTLSMGMSADLEAAIAAGATIVRIGTAIFGARRSET